MNQAIPFFNKISVRFFAVMTLMIVLPSSALFWSGFTTLETLMRKSAFEQTERAVGAMAKVVSNFFNEFLQVSTRISRNEFILAALRSTDDFYQRSAVIDRALDAETGLLPYSDELIISIWSSDESIFTNWSRNMNTYDQLRAMAVTKLALASEGYTVWESFALPYIKEEVPRPYKYISLAKTLENPDGGPPGLLLMSIRTTYLNRVLTNLGSDAESILALCTSNGQDWIHSFPKELNQNQLKNLVLKGESGDLVPRLQGAPHTGSWILAMEKLANAPGDLEGGSLVAIGLYNYGRLVGTFRTLLFSFTIVFLLLVSIAILMSYFITRSIVKPLGNLSQEMHRWEIGREPVRPLGQMRNDEIGSLQEAFIAMNSKINELFLAVQKEYKTREHYRFVSQQAQLNPHFLFNSLNTIRFMAIINKAPNMIDAIDAVARVLRHSLGRDTMYTTLEEELSSLESVLLIHNIRFGGRLELKVHYDSDDLLGRRILRFILYPAVENAIIHGYADQFGQGCIDVNIRLEEGKTIVEVVDYGSGMDAATLENLFQETIREQGIGLYNIKEMINTVHGAEGELTVTSEPGRGTKVLYRLPYIPDDQGGNV